MIIYIVAYEDSEMESAVSEESRAWRTEVSRVAISASTSTTVARLKYRYARALTKRTGTIIKGYISLLFHGRELVDHKTLAFYRVADGDLLTHTLNGRVGRSHSNIDYGQIADQLEGPVALDLDGGESSYDTAWHAGETWKSFPPVSYHNIWDTQSPAKGHEVTLSPKANRRPAKQRSPKLGDVQGGRKLKAGYHCSVQGCLFRIIHRMEGHWTGEMAELVTSRQHPGPLIANYDLTYNGGTRSWAEDRKLISQSTMAKRTQTTIMPVSGGTLVSIRRSTRGGEDQSMEEEITRYEEVGENILIVTTRDNTTGLVKKVETITLLDTAASMRTRISQIYEPTSSDGSATQLVSMIASTERRVVTEATGSLVVPDFTL